MAPVVGMNIFDSEPNDEQHNRHLDEHNSRVELGALLDSHHKNCCDYEGDQKCRQIESDFYSEDVRGIQQRMRACHQVSRGR